MFDEHENRPQLKLTIEIRKPVYAQDRTVRDAIPRKLWNAVRQLVHEENGFQCEICGGGDETSLHAHEVWEYDEEQFVLILEEIQSLCKLCHDLKHFHHAVLRIQDRRVREFVMRKLKKHFMKVNECTEKEFQRHYLNQLAKSDESPAERSLEDMLERKEEMQREAFLLRQDWRFSVGDEVPYKEEIESSLADKGLLFE
ncbi:hypothetical protein [Halobacillus salinus]|uniref:HNH endonuclease n=1 Tax=Halobacillus salinus TaxID=192814 RepID=A0A4Z0GWC3_9BACI|nr:hypothetical protein [Halobacillus salinus]TGB00740.1 hypothetical protein E4663_19180 [Halobacillus salinus]